MVEISYEDQNQIHYKLNSRIGAVFYKETKDIVLVNFRNNQEFLLVENFEEALQIRQLIKEIINFSYKRELWLLGKDELNI